jgi:putative acetyltransferase
MSSNVSIRFETAADISAVAQVHERAFGPNNPVPALVDDLRHIEGPFPTVSLVAQTDMGLVVGHVMSSHAWLDAPRELVDVMVLSPLGVLPEWQRRGIGSDLLTHAIAASEGAGAPLLFLEGNPAYYGARGFQAAVPMGFRPPSLRIPEAAFQVARLSQDSDDLTGTLVYRDVFWKHDCVGLRDPGHHRTQL